jgi:hypothetical protein
MCKVNIAACDKVTTPHRSTLRCWPPNIYYLKHSCVELGRANIRAEVVTHFRLTGYIYEA